MFDAQEWLLSLTLYESVRMRHTQTLSAPRHNIFKYESEHVIHRLCLRHQRSLTQNNPNNMQTIVVHAMDSLNAARKTTATYDAVSQLMTISFPDDAALPPIEIHGIRSIAGRVAPNEMFMFSDYGITFSPMRLASIERVQSLCVLEGVLLGPLPPSQAQ
jgi:hypothetical protein